MIHCTELYHWCLEHQWSSLMIIWVIGWFITNRLARYLDRLEAERYTWDNARMNLFMPIFVWPLVIAFILVGIFYKWLSKSTIFDTKDGDPPNWL